MELTHTAEGYKLYPRANVGYEPEEPAPSDAVKQPTFIRRLFSRDEKNCKETPDSNTCEKPVGGVMTVPIVLAVVIPIVVVACILFYLHRRKQRQERLEDMDDAHKSLDFGLGEGAAGKGKRRKSKFLSGGGEKGMSHSKSQLSMDMNLSSPYLLPPGLQQSRESLHSLARSLGPDTQDPYQYVATYTHSETGSVRSFNPNKDVASMHTKTSSKRFSSVTGKSIPSSRIAPPRQDSFPKSPTSPSDGKVNPFATPTLPEPVVKTSSPVELQAPVLPVKPIVPEIGMISDFDEKKDRDFNSNDNNVPLIRAPSPARTKSPQPAHPFELDVPVLPANNIGMAQSDDDFILPQSNKDYEPAGLGLNFDLPQPSTQQAPSPAPNQTGNQDTYDYYDYQEEVQNSAYYEDFEDYDRGRSTHRNGSPEAQQAQKAQQGLGVPQQETKRLSVGYRPLPPDEITESEDPEYRANRIRSFYKEYFEDTKEAPPPVPPVPRQHEQPAAAQYYEDYDQNYLGESAAYFDPETNAFVMPYAEPVTRRAMTPPPSGRFRGGPGGPGPRPRGPHGPHGSVGGMSAQAGPYGRPRAGSAYGQRHRAPSASSRGGSSIGPRPDSSASGRWRQPPRKKAPPPTALTTLPTPSKLRDDSFLTTRAIDFAPPDTIKDTAAGRSQSPLGERRVYSPKVPVHNPLVTAFDELSALPSPHLLRKSGTFTALDFAAPKKFRDPDQMSDAGSIRSNRSGISAAQLGAIRGGAGRVSRLPGDTVFTQASLQDQLKPQWGIRP